MPGDTFNLASSFTLRMPNVRDLTANDLQSLAEIAAGTVGTRRRFTLDASHADAVLVGILMASKHPFDIALVRDTAVAALPADDRIELAPGIHAWFDSSEPGNGQNARIRLNTSGTTGKFKTACYPLERLLSTFHKRADGAAAVWLLTFEPASFAGIQVLLTAAANGATLLAPPRTIPALVAAAQRRATHISGTPSFWRAMLAALPARARLPLKVATLGGETSSQDLLDAIASRFPSAAIRHIYASTEAGVGFTVSDGRAGFPAAWLDDEVDGVRLRVMDGELEIKSARGMSSYEGQPPEVKDNVWWRSGDLVAIEGDRVLFQGRRDAAVNVGGTKILPEKVEATLLCLPGVVDIAVIAHPSPIMGHILIAEVCAVAGTDTAVLESALRAQAAESLPPLSRPVRYRFVDSVVLASGKKGRKHGE